MISHHSSEDLLLVSKMFGEGSPQEVHRFVFLSLFMISMIESGENPCFKAHISEKSWISIGMAKWIDVPPDPRFDSELFKKKLMSFHHIIDHVLEVRTSFIMHAPAGINKFQSTFLDKHLYFIFELLRLFLIPHAEELHLNVSELALWIFQELLYNC